jgi:YVTN family beta-propeller protein
MMKSKLWLYAVCCLLVAVSSAQWLETVIPAGGRWSGILAYNAQDNKLYAGNYDSTVLVVDAENNQVIREVTVGTRPVGLLHNWLNDRLYVALGGNTSDTVVVIDGPTDEVRSRIEITGRSLNTLELNDHDNKLYVGSNAAPYTVGIIDCWSDSEAAVVDPPGSNWTHCAMHLDSTNRVYIPVLSSNYVMVLDGATDSIIRDSLRVGRSPICAGVDQWRNKAYFMLWDSDSLVVVDGSADSVVARIQVGYRPLAWAWNWIDDRIYCSTWGDSNLVVIDPVTYRRVEQLVYSRPKHGLFWEPLNNKLYLLSRDTNGVVVLSGSSNQVVATINLPGRPAGYGWNWEQNRLYVACEGGVLAVLRDSGGYAVEEPPTPGRSSGNHNAAATGIGATIVRGVLELPRDITELPGNSDRVPGPTLLDISGRRVLDLHPGANDVRHLAPGVYFVREAQAIRKVLVMR